MSSTIRSLVVKVGADLSGFKTGMTTASTGVTKFTNHVQNSQKSLSSFSSSLRSLFTGFSIVAIVAGISRFAKESTQLASDLVEVQNVVDVTFGQSAGIINQFAKDAAKGYGLTELSAKKFSGTMGAMLKSSGLTGEKLVEMSTGLSALAGDFASFYNLKAEDAFEKIQSGISGEIKPLRDLGINMSVANLEAFALSKGINVSYESMDQASKAILRYNYLLSVSTDAQGDFERTSGAYANQLRIANLNMQQFSATMGSGFMNIAYGVVRAFNDMSAALQSFASRFEIFTRIWFGDAKAIGQSAGAAAKSTNTMADAQNKLDKALKKSSASAKRGLLAFDKLNVLQEKSTGSSDVASAMADYYDAMAKTSGAVYDNTAATTEELAGWEKKLQGVYDKLYSFGYGPLYNFVSGWNGFWSGMGGKLYDAVSNWNSFYRNVGAKLYDYYASWMSYWRGVGSKLYDFVSGWNSFWRGVGGKLYDLLAGWNTFWRNVGSKLYDFTAGWNTFWRGVGSKLFEFGAAWMSFWRGAGAGLVGIFGGVYNWLSNMLDKLKSFFKGIGDWFAKLPQLIANAFNFVLPDWYYVLTGRTKPGTYHNSSSGNVHGGGGRSFATGTNYVPYTGPALVHQGEQITPASQNPYNGDSETNRLLRQLIAIESSRRTTSVQIGSREVVKATFSDLINEAKRTNTPWPVTV